ncbi:MAG: DNA-binding response regulator [Phycisphaerales bacterium]|nr:MAG: DNA-binding response regulator [Phycisphaerales bacterium]
MRLLVVEDYAPLRKSLCQGLQEAGYAVDASADGEEGLWFAKTNDYDGVVLDVMLPGRDGLSIVTQLRRTGRQTPILLLTARDTIQDRVHGLNLGADDYLVKPFAFPELLARVRALVRRRYHRRDPRITVGDLELDTAARTARRGRERIELTAREYALLEFLALRAGDVVTRTQIWEHLYDFDSPAESNVVDVYVGYLRKKIERPGLPKLIHTRRGQGYVLEAGDA